MADLNATTGGTNYWPGTNLTSYHNGICYGNFTLCSNSGSLCTPALCDISLGELTYIPSLGGNAFFAALFGLCTVAQIGLGIKYKTWAFMGSTLAGFTLEVVGYAARILLHNDIFDSNRFIIYIVCLTIAPALLSAAIYLNLARIIVVYGENMSRFKPRTYTILFMCCDFLALVLQAAGGAIASTSNTQSTTQTGINIMIAGLSAQVFSLFIFATLCTDFAFKCWRNPQSWNPTHASLYSSKLWRAFLCGLALATFTIFVRSCYRVAELQGGFNSSLANNQTSFMILEGAMVSIAGVCMTVLHPGVCFKGVYHKAAFHIRTKRQAKGESLSSFSENVETSQQQGHEMGRMRA